MEVIRENANNTTTVLWSSYKDNTSIEETVDPFTGLVCRAGDVHYAPHPSNIGAVSKTEDEEQRSPTFKRFDYSWDCPQCEGSGIAQFETIQLSDEYDDAAVEANLDTLLNNHNFTDIPEWDVSGEVIPGTDGDSALSLRQAPTSQAWKAEHTVDGDTIRKTKIQVRFLAAATYTVSTEAHLNPRDGEVRQAQKGEVVTFNPPAEQGAYFQVHACQALTSCLYPSSTHETDTSASEIVDGIEDDCPYELNARYIGGDGKRYKNFRTGRNFNQSFSYAIDFYNYLDFFYPGDDTPYSEEDERSWSGSYSNVDSTYEIFKTCEENVGTTGTKTTTWNESENISFTSCSGDGCFTTESDGTISGNVVTTYVDGASELTTNESEEEGTYDTFSGGYTRFDPVTASYPSIGRCNCSASEDPDFSVYRAVNFNPSELAGEVFE
jgi:hypothetical protein